MVSTKQGSFHKHIYEYIYIYICIYIIHELPLTSFGNTTSILDRTVVFELPLLVG